MSGPPPSWPPGWYPDPLGRFDHRYFNGSAWTADVSTDGARFVDPIGLGGGPAALADRPGRNRIATAAMVCGIVGAMVAWIPFLVVFGIALAVLAIVFGLVGRRRAATRGTGRGFAIAGVATGAAGLLLSVVGVALSVVVYRAIEEFVETGPVDARLVRCEPEGRDLLIAGDLTNGSEIVRDYTVFVVLVRPGPDGRAVRDVSITLEDVPSGATRPFAISIPVPDGEVECRLDEVRGPLPFGVDVRGAIDE